MNWGYYILFIMALIMLSYSITIMTLYNNDSITISTDYTDKVWFSVGLFTVLGLLGSYFVIKASLAPRYEKLKTSYTSKYQTKHEPASKKNVVIERTYESHNEPFREPSGELQTSPGEKSSEKSEKPIHNTPATEYAEMPQQILQQMKQSQHYGVPRKESEYGVMPTQDTGKSVVYDIVPSSHYGTLRKDNEPSSTQYSAMPGQSEGEMSITQEFGTEPFPNVGSKDYQQ